MGVRLLVPDRAGYGLSSPSPGRTVSAYAEDLVERISVCGVIVGAAPLDDEEVAGQIVFNRTVFARLGDRAALTAWLSERSGPSSERDGNGSGVTAMQSGGVNEPDVATVVADLGATLVVAVGGDLSARITSSVIADPAHPVDISPGTLVLAVGFDSSSPAFSTLRERVGSAGGAGILVKGSSVDAPATGLASVVIDPESEWSQVSALVRSATATPLPSSGETLFDVAEAVATLTGGSVVLHDASWELLAYSRGQPPDEVRRQTILGRAAPREQLQLLQRAGVQDRLARGEVVHIKSADISGLPERYAAGIVAGQQFLGSIWALIPETVSEAEALGSLRRAAEVAALPVLRASRQRGSGESERDEAFESLLLGARTERHVAEQMQVPLDRGFVLAGLQPIGVAGSDNPARREADAARLLGVARSYLSAYRVVASAAAVRDVVYLLVVGAGAERAQALKIVSDLHARARGTIAHRAIASSSFPSLGGAAATKTVLDGLLGLAERRGWSAFTDGEAVEASWRLEQFREVALAHPALLQGPAARLAEHDRQTGAELVATLRAWFDAVGDSRKAAEVLNLHVNTVRYRLRKAEEVSGLSLSNADDRLVAELQVRLLLS